MTLLQNGESLFRVHADDWVAGCRVLTLQPFNVLQLFVVPDSSLAIFGRQVRLLVDALIHRRTGGWSPVACSLAQTFVATAMSSIL